MRNPRRIPLLLVAVFFPLLGRAADVVVGSKSFTESYLLGEIAAQTIEASGKASVDRKLGMGSTGILFESLKSGAIDVYPDYTGTLAEAILKRPGLQSWEEIASALKPLGLTISKPLGFNNTYALAVRESFARKHHLNAIGDLRPLVGSLKAAFSYEFMDRRDGYRGMVDRYRLRFAPSAVRRMEHSLAYTALKNNSVDLIEVYSTDAKIQKLRLHVLEDPLGYFPKYEAVWVARTAFVENHPEAWTALKKIEGMLNEATMLHLNAEADIDKKSFASAAADFLGMKKPSAGSRLKELGVRTREHLWLVGISLLFSIVVGIPLGILAVRYRLAGQAILLVSGLVQTIPSLALLCFLIPFFGVGAKPALVALCLYSLLPVVLNTFTGIRAIDRKHLENARAFGLTRKQILFRVVLPLASPTLLAGVKTATIVSIGTATLAALVGAGGYGATIVSGLALNDIPTLLRGAIPAAILALLTHLAFEGIGKFVIPAGLRKSSG
jgi:osmoprotectant transport system permease protein